MPKISSAAASVTDSRARVKPYFSPAALAFLRGLARNNRREWFLPRKPIYERELKQPMLALIGAVNHGLQEFSPLHAGPPQKCMMRIYRDTRFSSDKRPYKSQVAAWWSAQGMERTSGAGFYVHVSAKEVVIAAGVYMPDRAQLLAIRKYLLEHHDEVRRLLREKKLKRLMDAFECEALSRPPKGFPREHPAMDLVRCRQWGVSSTLPAETALESSFPRQILHRFRLASPLVAALNTPLLVAEQPRRRLLFDLPVR